MDRELIIVDDCSTDGTWDILQRFAADHECIRLYRHPVNQGKGAAVRSAIQYATGEFCIVQDADLEYDPNEYPRLLKPLLDGRADAVFGSRYLAGEQTRVLPFWHSMINKFLTVTSNMFSNLNVTDMETCYKVFRTELLKTIPIRSNRFGFEPEITMKCAKRKLRVYEVPISYHGRTYEEGKKIGWKDGVKVFGVLVYFWVVDDLYLPRFGRGSVNAQYATPHYLAWITQLIRPHLRDTVLEIGAGIGNYAGRLMARRTRYVAAESDPVYLQALRNRFLRTPNVEVAELKPEADAQTWPASARNIDTALCLNVLEYAEDPAAVLRNIRATLAPNANLLILVPQGRRLYGAVDSHLGLKRRFEREDLVGLLDAAGFEVKAYWSLNRAARIGWWLYSDVIRRPHVPRLSLKVFDKTVWLWRRLDAVLPWPGLSLLVLARPVSD
jgi:SAM-dependent methyltransferase